MVGPRPAIAADVLSELIERGLRQPFTNSAVDGATLRQATRRK